MSSIAIGCRTSILKARTRRVKEGLHNRSQRENIEEIVRQLFDGLIDDVMIVVVCLGFRSRDEESGVCVFVLVGKLAKYEEGRGRQAASDS